MGTIVKLSTCIRHCRTKNNLFSLRRNIPAVVRGMVMEATTLDDTPPLDTATTKNYHPKIVQLVDEISSLTLKEVTNLNELLKTTLNIKDVPVYAAAPTTSSSESPVEEEDQVPEQIDFTIKLVSFSAPDKIKLIKAVKSVNPELNLVHAKKFVESLPQVVYANIEKEKAEEYKTVLEEAGGSVEII